MIFYRLSNESELGMLVRMSECEGKCEPNRSFDFEPLAMSVIGMQPDAYDFVQAKQSFENARQKIVPDGWEEYVESTKDDDHIKIWRRYDPAVRPISKSTYFMTFKMRLRRFYTCVCEPSLEIAQGGKISENCDTFVSLLQIHLSRLVRSLSV